LARDDSPAADCASTGVPEDGSGVAGVALEELSLFEHAPTRVIAAMM